MIRTATLTVALMGLVAQSTEAGLYTGAGIGPDTVAYKENAHIFQPGSFDAINVSHLSGTGLFGTLFAGYAWINGHLYLAGEVNGNISSLAHKASNEEYVHTAFAYTRFKMNNSVGISALPGYQYSPDTLFYARLGYTSGHFKSSTTDTSLVNLSRRLNGFRYGVGIKRFLTDKVALRMDYSRVDYQSLAMHTLDVNSNTTKNFRLTPHQQLVEFSLIYHFDDPAPVPSK